MTIDKQPLLLFAVTTDMKTTIDVAKTLNTSTDHDQAMLSRHTSSGKHALLDAKD